MLLILWFSASGKIDNIETLKAADSPSVCFAILLDENRFSQDDVVLVQFLCKETSCSKLYAACINYALEHRKLCFYDNISGMLNY